MARARMEKQMFVFLIPPLLLLGIPLFCVGFTILLSFTDATLYGGVGSANFVGVENYLNLIGDPIFHTSLLNNFIFLFSLVTFPIIIGLVIAIFLSFKVKGGEAFKALFYFPMILSFVISGTIWSWIFKTSGGLINTALTWVGLGSLSQSFLSDPSLVMLPLTLVGVWHILGYPIILFGAGLVDVPEAVVDAARMEASTFRVYRHVVVPLLKPLILGVTILAMINAFKVFDLVFIMTYGGPFMSSYVLAFMVYIEAIARALLGYGSAVGVALLVISLACIAAVIYAATREEGQ